MRRPLPRYQVGELQCRNVSRAAVHGGRLALHGPWETASGASLAAEHETNRYPLAFTHSMERRRLATAVAHMWRHPSVRLLLRLCR